MLICTSINKTKAQVFTEIRKKKHLIIDGTEWLHDFVTILPEDVHRGTTAISSDEEKKKNKKELLPFGVEGITLFLR